MLIGKVPDNDAAAIVIAKVRTIDTHRPGGLPIASQGHTHRDTLILERTVFLVDEKIVLHGIIGDTYIHPPVVVGVDQGDPKRLGLRHSRGRIDHMQSRFLANFFELATPLVVIKIHVHTIEVRRLAIGTFEPYEG